MISVPVLKLSVVIEVPSNSPQFLQFKIIQSHLKVSEKRNLWKNVPHKKAGVTQITYRNIIWCRSNFLTGLIKNSLELCFYYRDVFNHKIIMIICRHDKNESGKAFANAIFQLFCAIVLSNDNIK